MDAKKLHSFKSRKNEVSLIETRGGQKTVLKEYPPEEKQRTAIEFAILVRAGKSGVSVPKILQWEEGFIRLEFLEGRPLVEAINDPEIDMEEKQAMATALGHWLCDFHSAFSKERIIRGDCTLRNFLWDDENGKVWGLDFEDAAPGSPADDIAESCASILDTDPKFTLEKVRLCRAVLSAYGKSGRCKLPENVEMDRHIAASLETHAARRAEPEPLLEAARAVREGGLEAASKAVPTPLSEE